MMVELTGLFRKFARQSLNYEQKPVENHKIVVFVIVLILTDLPAVAGMYIWFLWNREEREESTSELIKGFAWYMFIVFMVLCLSLLFATIHVIYIIKNHLVLPSSGVNLLKDEIKRLYMILAVFGLSYLLRAVFEVTIFEDVYTEVIMRDRFKYLMANTWPFFLCDWAPVMLLLWLHHKNFKDDTANDADDARDTSTSSLSSISDSETVRETTSVTHSTEYK